MVAVFGSPPAAPLVLLLSAQWSRRIAAGTASLRSLAYWASASLHPALLSLGSAPLLKGAAAEAAEDCLIPAKAVEMRKSVSHR